MNRRIWLAPAALLAGVFVFMTLAAALYLPFWEEAFRSDDSPVSWLSSALLVAGAILSLRLCAEETLPWRFGLPLVLALTALALDEQFMLHEWMKHAWLPARVHPAPVSWQGDLPVWIVAAGGVLFGGLAGRCGFAGAALWLLRAAIGVGLFAIWVDLGSPPVWLAFLEEGGEVLAEAIFLCALLVMQRRA